ncbi:Glutathione S-transferase, mu [Sparganum proliferum]
MSHHTQLRHKLELVHWNIRDQAQPIRLLLEYVDASYKEIRYEKDESSKWLKKKEKAKLDFPNIKYVDFYLYEMLEVCEYFDKSTFCAFSNFVDYKKRFEAIPQISKYMKSKSFLKWPLFTWIASFGGGTVAPPEAS